MIKIKKILKNHFFVKKQGTFLDLATGNSFSKIGLRHILGISILHLCAKIQKIPMVLSREKLVTNKRTGINL